MSIRNKRLKYAVIVIPAAVVGIGWWRLAEPRGNSTTRTVDIKVPRLSALAENGKPVFESNRAACRGRNAAGTDKGPPLIHDIYNPGYHSDRAFSIAAEIGMRTFSEAL